MLVKCGKCETKYRFENLSNPDAKAIRCKVCGSPVPLVPVDSGLLQDQTPANQNYDSIYPPEEDGDNIMPEYQSYNAPGEADLPMEQAEEAGADTKIGKALLAVKKHLAVCKPSSDQVEKLRLVYYQIWGVAKFQFRNALDCAKNIISDLKEMDLKREIIPIDEEGVNHLRKDTVFWTVALLGIIPLFLITLTGEELQLNAFAIFFAFIWGILFKRLVIEDPNGWKVPITSFAFTGVLGVNLLLILYKLLPAFYLDLNNSESLLISGVGYVLQVGVCEELCKIAPVLIYILWRRQKADPITIVTIGVFSGLGFAALENTGYFRIAALRSVLHYEYIGASGLMNRVQGAMINALLRNLSATFGHAVWSGIFAYFLAFAVLTGRRIMTFFVLGLAVSAIAHGLYDWFLRIQILFSTTVTGLSFALFYAYIKKLRFAMSHPGPLAAIPEYENMVGDKDAC